MHHLSCVICHVSHVKCHIIFLSFSLLCFFFFFWQSICASRWRVCYQTDLEKTIFLWTLKFLEGTFGRKKRVNYDKFEIVTNCYNQLFNLKALCFFLLTGLTWYYHTIYFSTYLFCIIYRLWKLFLICTFKDPKFGEKITRFGGKFEEKKVELHGVHGVCFFQVCYQRGLPRLVCSISMQKIIFSRPGIARNYTLQTPLLLNN